MEYLLFLKTDQRRNISVGNSRENTEKQLRQILNWKVTHNGELEKNHLNT